MQKSPVEDVHRSRSMRPSRPTPLRTSRPPAGSAARVNGSGPAVQELVTGRIASERRPTRTGRHLPGYAATSTPPVVSESRITLAPPLPCAAPHDSFSYSGRSPRSRPSTPTCSAVQRCPSRSETVTLTRNPDGDVRLSVTGAGAATFTEDGDEGPVAALDAAGAAGGFVVSASPHAEITSVQVTPIRVAHRRRLTCRSPCSRGTAATSSRTSRLPGCRAPCRSCTHRSYL